MRRVLVIDDHESSRKQILATLKDGGYEIAGEGTSGKLAVALARTALPDVLLMAVGLPDLDGIEAARDVMLAQPLPIVRHQRISGQAAAGCGTQSGDRARHRAIPRLCLAQS